ncbi:MAG: transcriptional regulator [Oscillospiraceae bacterium]|nr:transcriptional regulator [Oscillospiraceae bacterium]
MTERKKIGVGYRLGALTVIEETDRRKNGYMVWSCLCDCGGRIELDTRTLQRGTVTDCGCRSRVRPGQRDLTGQKFGRLTALRPTDQRSAKGDTIWLCRCDCGKEAAAPLSQLTQGYKKSCGCLARPPRKDLTGKRFGRLTVLDYWGKKAGMHRWECRCDCGKIAIAGQTLLQSGKTKSCGCLGHPPVQDILGQQFGELTAVEYAGKKDRQYYWRCRCSCGKEAVVRQSYLLSGKTKSCGCLQARIVTENMKFVDGTSVTMLERTGQRLSRSNSSGYNGVYFNRRAQKWAAQIGFKGKTYYLGCYQQIEEAVEARKKAEERIYGEFLDWYYEYHAGKPRASSQRQEQSR